MIHAVPMLTNGTLFWKSAPVIFKSGSLKGKLSGLSSETASQVRHDLREATSEHDRSLAIIRIIYVDSWVHGIALVSNRMSYLYICNIRL